MSCVVNIVLIGNALCFVDMILNHCVFFQTLGLDVTLHWGSPYDERSAYIKNGYRYVSQSLNRSFVVYTANVAANVWVFFFCTDKNCGRFRNQGFGLV